MLGAALLTIAILGALGTALGLLVELTVAAVLAFEESNMGDDWPALQQRFAAEAAPPARALKSDREQGAHLERARDCIAPLIRAFWAERRAADGAFTADELRDYVGARLEAAPASPDRILRAMRQDGELDYVVVNRKRSQYRFVYTREAA